MGRTKRMPVATRKRIQEKLRKEKLTQFGYDMDAKERTRHRALAKAVDHYGASSVFKSLLLLRTWNRDQNPRLATIADKDAKWVGKTYGVEENGFRFT